MRLRRLFSVCSSITLGAVCAIGQDGQAQSNPPKKPTAPNLKTSAAPASPQSTHYPILLFGHGAEPGWSILIGQKGPERFDRTNYPPIALEPVNVSGEGIPDAWVYHAKDSATGSDVTIHLKRQACVDAAGAPEPPLKAEAAKSSTSNAAPVRNSFAIEVEHAEIGKFQGCARIAAELFPKIVNQSADDDDSDKKKPPVTTITNFKVPTATAYLNAAGKIVVSRGAVKKLVPVSGTELALSHDGKKLLYTRNDSKMGSERTIVSYDFDTGRSTELVHGAVREAFWSPDDSRIAYLQSQDQKWRVMAFLVHSPETTAVVYNGAVDALHGWVDGHTLLASDGEMLYWLRDDRPQQSLSLREINGDAFRVSETDTIRVNPVNADLLLVSAKYAAPGANGSGDSGGVFLYEVRAKRRVALTPAEQWASHGEWSRDGIQVLYTRHVSATSSGTFRVFWDGSGVRRFQDGTDLVVGQ